MIKLNVFEIHLFHAKYIKYYKYIFRFMHLIKGPLIVLLVY